MNYNLECPEVETLASLSPSKITNKKIHKAISATWAITDSWAYNKGARLQVARRALAVVDYAITSMMKTPRK